MLDVELVYEYCVVTSALFDCLLRDSIFTSVSSSCKNHGIYEYIMRSVYRSSLMKEDIMS